MSDVLVLGLGNALMSDEGLGVHALHRLTRDCHLPTSVTCVDGGTLGLELLVHLEDAERVLVLDAVDAEAEPGTFVRLEGTEDWSRMSRGLSPHQIRLADVTAAATLRGIEWERFVVLGLQPASLELGTEPTPIVAEQLPRLVERAVAELVDWGVDVPTQWSTERAASPWPGAA